MKNNPKGSNSNGTKLSNSNENKDRKPDEVTQVNIFTKYASMENQFTNGLISILRLTTLEDSEFVNRFFNSLLNTKVSEPFQSFQVLEGYEDKSTVDAVLKSQNAIIQFETKICSGAIREDQMESHLENIRKCSEAAKYLIMLTPDDSNSEYVKKFIIEPELIYHLEWKAVFKFLSEYEAKNSILKEIISQYLSTIKKRIFEEDIVGIIAKISFSKITGVDAKKYLNEMKNGEWTEWNTPDKYKSLNGTGRKLLLYDPECKAITVEVEIAKVEETGKEPNFPWTNSFVLRTLHILEKPIRLDNIKKVEGFENFSRGQSPYRNITHEKYKQLMEISGE